MLARLRKARLAAGLTQVDAAKALGRTQAFVSKCELGERRIDPIDLLDFARLYRKPFGFFLPDGPKS
jgi:transcriptional regulator with XRE-family HTH domain